MMLVLIGLTIMMLSLTVFVLLLLTMLNRPGKFGGVGFLMLMLFTGAVTSIVGLISLFL